VDIDGEVVTDHHVRHPADDRPVEIPRSADQTGEDHPHVLVNIHHIRVDEFIIQRAQGPRKTGNQRSGNKRHPLVKIGVIPQEPNPIFVFFNGADKDPIGRSRQPLQEIKDQKERQ
jgi:hypothetical protein